MRRKALLGVVVAAVLPLAIPATSYSQTPAPAPAPVRKPQATNIQPQWKVQPTPAPAPAVEPAAPQVTAPATRGYTTSEFEELLKPTEWPRVDPIRGNPNTNPQRQDNDYGLDSAPAYESTRPENPLGPY
ncbi:hypothetical protein [Caulobacter sp. 17J80-11]|uniref:hypothetical protein n=1 Tax=Caulobacter sp. 17J80-11 TaxID=2763502 RepID=UPI00165378FF|nr:hypothetical protein [Caulobacter sp. 17J80-11]MBC6982914.1 hypothetical protein [Caulobacter sp. 17J80-11]